MRVLLIHGAFQNKDVWRVFEQKLKCKGYESKAINMPGRIQEESQKRASFSLEKYVETIQDEIERNEEGVSLICHSFGGIYGTIAASRCLGHVKSIIYLAANIAEQGDSMYSLLADCSDFQQELKRAVIKGDYINRSEEMAKKYFVNECSNEAKKVLLDCLCSEPALPYFGLVNYAGDWKNCLEGRIIYYRGMNDIPINFFRAKTYAQKAGAVLREIKGDHQLMLSNPEGLVSEIAEIIRNIEQAVSA